MSFARLLAIADVDDVGCHDGEDGRHEEIELLAVPDLFEDQEDDADAKKYIG